MGVPMRLVAEFTTEPFEGEGEPPAHATEAFDVARRAGLQCEFGPLGTSVRGEAEELYGVVGQIMATAFGRGATRITLQVERDDRD